MLERTLYRARSAESLHARRRRRTRRLLVASGVVLLALLALSLWGLWQPGMRVTRIEVTGGDESYVNIAEDAMRGTFYGIVPRNSIFFVPAQAIRSALMNAHPEIAAISISSASFDSLSLTVTDRTPIARWCGSAYAPRLSVGSTTNMDIAGTSCYLFDAGGFIYAPFHLSITAATSTASSTAPLPLAPADQAPVNAFRVFEPVEASASTIGETLPNANLFPGIFDFARKLSLSGANVDVVAIHDGQVDDYLSSGTRVSYLLGGEQGAYTALKSASAQLNLADGSLEYVDLRFPGKVYLKKAEAVKKP